MNLAAFSASIRGIRLSGKVFLRLGTVLAAATACAHTGSTTNPTPKPVAQRDSARSHGRYDEADAIRDRLAAAGVEVQDGPAGTSWEWRELT